MIQGGEWRRLPCGEGERSGRQRNDTREFFPRKGPLYWSVLPWRWIRDKICMKESTDEFCCLCSTWRNGFLDEEECGGHVAWFYQGLATSPAGTSQPYRMVIGIGQDRTSVDIKKAVLRLFSTTGGMVSSQRVHVQIGMVSSGADVSTRQQELMCHQLRQDLRTNRMQFISWEGMKQGWQRAKTQVTDDTESPSMQQLMALRN